MIYVKVGLTDYDDQDTQYIEVPEGTPEAIPINELPDRAWAVKEPSDACIEQSMPGCLVQVFNDIPFLLSPKALLYFPTQNSNRDVALLTFNMPGSESRDCHFLMVHLKGRHFWHLPWCERGQLFTFLQMSMGINNPMKRIGLWRVLKQHHKVIDFKTYILFSLFHSHLTFNELEFIFGFCGVEGALNNVDAPQVFPLNNHPHFHSLMVVSKAFLSRIPKMIQDVLVDQWHTDAVNTALKGNRKGCRRLAVQRVKFL